MINLTISGGDSLEFQANVAGVLAMFGAAAPQTVAVRNEPKSLEELTPAPKAKPARAKAAATAAEPGAALEPAPTPEDLEMQRELNAPVEKAPATAATLVDAGTGKPAAQTAMPEEPAIKMTVDDVKRDAAKLVQKDINKLKELLAKYNAANVALVPPAQLGDFAADVRAALA